MTGTIIGNYNPKHEIPTYTSILLTAYGQICALLKQQFMQVLQYRRDRKAFLELLDMEDELLADIGVSRANVIWASKLPIEINASRELENIAQENRKVT